MLITVYTSLMLHFPCIVIESEENQVETKALAERWGKGVGRPGMSVNISEFKPTQHVIPVLNGTITAISS